MQTLWTMPLSVLLATTVLAQAPMTQAPSTSTPVPTLTDTEMKQAVEQQGFSNALTQSQSGSHADVTATTDKTTTEPD